MRNNYLVSAIFASSVALLSGCGQPTEALKDEGIATFDKPEVTTTCYDYAGNTVVSSKASTNNLEVKPAGVVVKQDGHKPLIVTNGGGCVVEERYFDASAGQNKAIFDAAAKSAPVYGVVTNASDAILHSGKYSDVSYDDQKGTVSFSLTSPKGTAMMKVTVTGGLNTIATDNYNSLGASLRDAMAAPTPAAN